MAKPEIVVKHGIEHVSIPEFEYEKLSQDALLLTALIAAGVENWDGYAYAQELIKAVETKG